MEALELGFNNMLTISPSRARPPPSYMTISFIRGRASSEHLTPLRLVVVKEHSPALYLATQAGWLSCEDHGATWDFQAVACELKSIVDGGMRLNINERALISREQETDHGVGGDNHISEDMNNQATAVGVGANDSPTSTDMHGQAIAAATIDEIDTSVSAEVCEQDIVDPQAIVTTRICKMLLTLFKSEYGGIVTYQRFRKLLDVIDQQERHRQKETREHEEREIVRVEKCRDRKGKGRKNGRRSVTRNEKRQRLKLARRAKRKDIKMEVDRDSVKTEGRNDQQEARGSEMELDV